MPSPDSGSTSPAASPTRSPRPRAAIDPARRSGRRCPRRPSTFSSSIP